MCSLTRMCSLTCTSELLLWRTVNACPPPSPNPSRAKALAEEDVGVGSGGCRRRSMVDAESWCQMRLRLVLEETYRMSKRDLTLILFHTETRPRNRLRSRPISVQKRPAEKGIPDQCQNSFAYYTGKRGLVHRKKRPTDTDIPESWVKSAHAKCSTCLPASVRDTRTRARPMWAPVREHILVRELIMIIYE